MGYIRQEKLSKLKEYKYAGLDQSLLSKYVLKPFYSNVAIKAFPLSMAPNAITLTGFSFVVINFITMLWYNPTLDRDCPPWVYASWSIGLFLYQTFDAVDGTQARRTGQSGPLGELFDHGVDACNTTLEVLLFAAATNMGQSWRTVMTLAACLFTFYVQSWDEYHTHQLTLGLISGPVEGIMTLIAVFGITAAVGGGSFWDQSMLNSIGIANSSIIPNFIYKLSWTETWMGYGGAVLVFNTYQSAMNVIQARRDRKEDPIPALLGLVPPVFAWILVGLYLHLRPSILHYHLVPFALYVGLVNAYFVGQIIVAHVTKSNFPTQNILLAPLLFGVLDSAGPWLQERVGFGWPSALGVSLQVAFVFMCLGLAVGVYGSFVVDVIHSICDYLDIWCLTIKHPLPEHEKAKDKAKGRKKK